MFSKILVANRGEIACRIFASARKMGIKTVAVYSDVDEHALHVKHADETFCLGGTTAAESYLVADKIIDACKQSGSDALHPGYGFLSEQAEFAEELAAAGITLIGPSPNAMRLMGDKITSKKLSAEAGVNTIPGFMGLISDAEHCARISEDIGYPVMIKASAGGGGKGMRIAWNEAEAREGFDRSRSEAQSSFGDDRIFVEKFITNPRHIEIQVLADNFGECLYLGERECSIQRRNQKVVEEAPSPFIDEQTRQAMGEQAVGLAKAVEYASAGTVEFVVDENRNFYFLEMNTRLQVEHPVTELITGVDLVEQMIRVAAGEKLQLTQDDIVLNGWAVESRIYAEDPYRQFLPSIGRIQRYREPATNVDYGSHRFLADSDEIDSLPNLVRCDSGVEEGGEISMYYDPMIAKLCTWAPERKDAIAEMGDALDAYDIQGVGNNLHFVSAIMQHERFKEGRLTTAFIEEEYPDGFMPLIPDTASEKKFVAITAVLNHIATSSSIESVNASEVLNATKTEKNLQLCVRIGKNNSHFDCSGSQGLYSIAVEGESGADSHQFEVVTDWQPGRSQIKAVINGSTSIMQVQSITGGYGLTHQGCQVQARVLSAKKAGLANLMIDKAAADTSKMLLCPMPGLLVTLHVAEGDDVEQG
ncbi:MAG: biotin carboxylase N-terminal domain-containing protein, partial [Granulosicoccus sp.]